MPNTCQETEISNKSQGCIGRLGGKKKCHAATQEVYATKSIGTKICIPEKESCLNSKVRDVLNDVIVNWFYTSMMIHDNTRTSSN